MGMGLGLVAISAVLLMFWLFWGLTQTNDAGPEIAATSPSHGAVETPAEAPPPEARPPAAMPTEAMPQEEAAPTPPPPPPEASAPIERSAPAPRPLSASELEAIEKVVWDGRRLTAATLERVDCDDLWMLRNTIYARHGYAFKTAKAVRHFANEANYDRNITVHAKTVGKHLTAPDKANAALVKGEESRRGCH